MKKIKPYSDNKLTYDETTKMYVLTKEYINENHDNPYADDEMLEKRLKLNSRVIYRYIYKVGNSHNRHYVDILLNQTQEGRDFLFDVLSTQMEADLETGINSLGNVPRINVKNGQVLDKEAMTNGYLSQYTLDLLESNSGVFGVNILYSRPYDFYTKMKIEGDL